MKAGSGGAVAEIKRRVRYGDKERVQMRIHYREIENGIEVVRCFGSDGEITIPEMIGGKPVIRAAAYAFSARKGREDEDILVCETGELLLFRQQETLLAGENVLRVRFPDTLREIGKYIFYGCRNLEHLSFSDSLTEIGSGAFTGCRSLNSLNVHLCRGKRSCVPEILGDLWQRIDVEFWAESAGSRNWQVRLVFPEHYEEAVENTPARILFTQHHGSGNNYRQCFYNKEMDYRKYDDLFSVAKAHDRISVLTDLIFARLMYPEDLTEPARERYESYIREHGAEAAAYLTDTENHEALRLMSERMLWTPETIDAAVDYAASVRAGEILSFLLDEKHKMFPAGKKKYEL